MAKKKTMRPPKLDKKIVARFGTVYVENKYYPIEDGYIYKNGQWLKVQFESPEDATPEED